VTTPELALLSGKRSTKWLVFIAGAVKMPVKLTIISLNELGWT